LANIVIVIVISSMILTVDSTMPTSAEIRVRQVASKIGLSDANPEILETVCEQMRQEFVVEEWQLPALDSFQWKSLQAPIGLAAAVRQLSIAYDVVSIPTMVTEVHNTDNQGVATPSTTTTTSPSVPDAVNDTVDENLPRLPKEPQKVLSHLLKVIRFGEVLLTEDSDENNSVEIFEDDEEDEESVPDRGGENVESLLEPTKNGRNVDPEHSGDRTNDVGYVTVDEEFYKTQVIVLDQPLTEEQPAASVETSSPKRQRRKNSVPKQGVNRVQGEPPEKFLHRAATLPTILMEKGNVVDSKPHRVEEDDHTIKSSNVSRRAPRRSTQVRCMRKFSPGNKGIVCIFLLVIHVFVSFLSKLQRSGPPATSEANTGKLILY
jgi:hypothetical protein